MSKSKVGLILLIVCIPAIIILGVVAFNDRAYAWISLCVAIVACIPLFISFEKKNHSSSKLVVLAVLIALSVAGRFIFSFIPHFKPVTAMVVITGIYFGYESGFICGAFTALISNFMFGQGPWTPFQMFAWGIIGLIAGLMSKFLVNHMWGLLVYGALSGVLFSFLMDIWTTLWWDGTFNFSRFLANIISALPVTGIYALSNVIFLLVLIKPLGKKLDRIKTKYGL
jgi:uncharacterized membrane protein